MFNQINTPKHKNINPQERWQTALRTATFAGVLFLWSLSVEWSASGLQAKNPDDPRTQFMGYGLALFFTVAQLVFNRGAINPTIFVVGLFAYIYGISTNLIGIMQVFDFDLSMSALQTDLVGWILDVILGGSLAFGVEVAPEAFLLWALNPKRQRPGDFVSTVLSGRQIFNVQEHGQNVPVNNSKNVQQNTKQFKLPKNGVVRYIVQYYVSNNKSLPSYAVVVQNTSLTSKSQVRNHMDAAKDFIKQNNL